MSLDSTYTHATEFGSNQKPNIMSEKDLDVTTMNVRVNKQQIATIDLGFQISTRDELDKIIDKLRQIEGMRDITRTRG